MGTGAGYDWVYAAAGWAVGAAGVLLLLWALFWDRSRGRRRCPKCWYDMAGVAGLRCPECGKEAKRERRLRRTRRRWVWAGTALPLLVGAVVIPQLPAMVRNGFWSVVPTSVLVMIAPMEDQAWTTTFGATTRSPRILSPAAASLRELIRRSENRQLSDREWRAFWRRLLRACPDQAGNFLFVRDRWPRALPIIG